MENRLEFRGISQETMIQYLLSIANLTHEHIIANKDMSVIIKKPHWSVFVSKEDTYQASPVVSFPRLYLSFSGEEDIIHDVIRKLRTKTIRLGG